jgi:hypothetical protein
MKNKKELYEELKQKVSVFIEEFNDKTKNDKVIDDLLCGWRILYSDIKEHCDVLLVGINPGSGEKIGARNYELDALEKLEYIDDSRNKYSLSFLVNRIFEKAGLFELLENSTMKTNTKFYASYGTDELSEFENHLAENHIELYKELMGNNKIWIKELVNIIQPKIIIAEGKAAFLYLDDEIFTNENNDWTNIITWNGVVGAWKRNDGLVLFGFSRRRGNFDDEIAEYLKQVLIFN